MKATINKMDGNLKVGIAVILGALAMLLFINLFSNNLIHSMTSSHYCPMAGSGYGWVSTWIVIILIAVLLYFTLRNKGGKKNVNKR